MSKADDARKHRLSRAEEICLRGQRQQDAGNLASGFRLLLSAAKMGDPVAQNNLGYTYDVGLGIRPNRDAAMFWYMKAYRSKSGDGLAANNIGTIFRDEHNDPEAIRWFKRAVQYGNADANLELAKIYLKNPKLRDKAVSALNAILKATPPIGVGEDTQREARKLLRKIKMIQNVKTKPLGS